jgi:hypothetical protein
MFLQLNSTLQQQQQRQQQLPLDGRINDIAKPSQI